MSELRFSVIMASRLEWYPNQAQYIDQKLIRAIDSLLNQSYSNFELIVIADDNNLTKDLVNSHFPGKTKLLEINHKGLFDNGPRNTGIDNAKGEFIIYCDIDDYWGADHLKIINEQLNDYKWVYYNDFVWDKRSDKWIQRACNIRILGQCGTSNVCHRRDLGIRWGRPGYAHDYHFIKSLIKFTHKKRIETPEYYVMHIPGSGGYDL